MFLIYKKCKYIVKQNNCKLKSYYCFAQLNLRFILNKIPLYLQISKDKNNVFCTNAKNMFSKITNQRYWNKTIVNRVNPKIHFKNIFWHYHWWINAKFTTPFYSAYSIFLEADSENRRLLSWHDKDTNQDKVLVLTSTKLVLIFVVFLSTANQFVLL